MTPRCPACGDKFPGDPCKNCGLPAGASLTAIAAAKLERRIVQVLRETKPKTLAERRARRAEKRSVTADTSRRRRAHGR
jgi:hypothetical protein